MTDQQHDVSRTDTGVQSRGVGSTTNRPTSASDATVDRIPAVGLAADEVVARHNTALFATHREDGVWVTECAWCKRMRNVGGDWETLSPFVRSTIRATRTHGICSDCADRCLIDAVGR